MIDGALKQDVVDEAHDLAEPAAARVFGEKGAGEDAGRGADQVAIAVIARLPKIALSRPPVLPGGGVVWVNRVGLSAPMPLISSVASTKTRNSRPNAVAASDSADDDVVDERGGGYRAASALTLPRLLFQAHQHQLGRPPAR